MSDEGQAIHKEELAKEDFYKQKMKQAEQTIIEQQRIQEELLEGLRRKEEPETNLSQEEKEAYLDLKKAKQPGEEEEEPGEGWNWMTDPKFIALLVVLGCVIVYLMIKW